MDKQEAKRASVMQVTEKNYVAETKLVLEALDTVMSALTKAIEHTGYLPVGAGYASATYARLLAAQRDINCAAHMLGAKREEPCDEAVYY